VTWSIHYRLPLDSTRSSHIHIELVIKFQEVLAKTQRLLNGGACVVGVYDGRTFFNAKRLESCLRQ
jgi:hypothetical protein